MSVYFDNGCLELLLSVFVVCMFDTQTPVPVKWMALESLTHKIYTSKSDVYVSSHCLHVHSLTDITS